MSMYNQTILAANAYYNNGPKELKERIWEFFKSVDTNRDGGVSFDEFLHYLHQSDYIRVIDPRIFTLLDVRRDGSLEFSEFLTFYYILEISNSNTAQPNHQQMGVSYHQAINSDGGFQHYAAAFNPMTLFQAPPNHQQTGISYHQPINSDGSFQHYAAAFNPMALFQEPPNHQQMGISYHQAINSDGSLQHYAAVCNPMALFQAPPNHQQTGISYHQPINSDGSFQHYAAAFNPMATPVCLNQVPTTKPGASSCCCCGSNNNELMPTVVAYKPPLSKSEKRLKVAKKTGKAVVHSATVVGATAAVLVLL